MRAHWRKEEWVLGVSYFWARSCYTFFLACVTIRINFLKFFAVRAVWDALEPHISVINVVSNLIWVRSQIRRQVRLTRKNTSFEDILLSASDYGSKCLKIFSVSYLLILHKSRCGSNCYISFRVFYHWFCAQMTARAMMISRVTASGSGMCGVLAFVFFH